MSKVDFKSSSSTIQALEVMLKSIDKKRLEAGWFESAKYDDNTPVAGIMAQNEYGNPARSIPPRPFMRQTVAGKSDSWATLSDQAFERMIRGKMTPDNALNILGLRVVADIKGTIVASNFAPLSPITLALRRLRDDNVPIGGALIGRVATAIYLGETGAGQLGQPSANTDPLRDTGYAFSTLTYEVSNV